MSNPKDNIQDMLNQLADLAKLQVKQLRDERSRIDALPINAADKFGEHMKNISHYQNALK